MRSAAVALYRVRGILVLAPTLALLAIAFFGSSVSGHAARQTITIIAGIALAGWAIAFILVMVGPRLLPRTDAEVVTAPVRGRWLALNSPASKVPSHGVRAYGQAYAIDLVHEPEDAVRPVFGTGAMMRPNTDYPAFGQPVLSMVDGVVVTASDWHRDHRARSTMLGVAYMMIEGVVREMGGPRFVLGNHITIRTDGGAFALVAHLKQGSARVAVGDVVHAGDVIGQCGNSGNSSEPHVHAQLMDRSTPSIAQGIPIVFSGIAVDGDETVVEGLPGNEQHMNVN